MVPAAAIARFRADFDELIDPGMRVGVAVSGGPDSMALLLLTVSIRPGKIEAATVDHGLRDGSPAEAEMVAATCERLRVPHSILTIDWDSNPKTAIQERAREARYGALSEWMRSRRIDVLLTAHHLDDQAETLLMRLNRGSGSKGLAGMRRISFVPGARDLTLARPLLQWRRPELEAICTGASLAPAADPSNEDARYERVRVRRAIAEAKWLDPEALARSATNLACAEEAISWAANREWTEFVTVRDDTIVYTPSDAPAEIVRRVVARVIGELGNEGEPNDIRGRQLSQLIRSLHAGRTTTLRGVRCGGDWRFSRAKGRKI